MLLIHNFQLVLIPKKDQAGIKYKQKDSLLVHCQVVVLQEVLDYQLCDHLISVEQDQQQISERQKTQDNLKAQWTVQVKLSKPMASLESIKDLASQQLVFLFIELYTLVVMMLVKEPFGEMMLLNEIHLFLPDSYLLNLQCQHLKHFHIHLILLEED